MEQEKQEIPKWKSYECKVCVGNPVFVKTSPCTNEWSEEFEEYAKAQDPTADFSKPPQKCIAPYNLEMMPEGTTPKWEKIS